ncbi:MAG: hypothetical protein IJN00_05070, partial [Clostridia bacterium]|nr:hypothetical protein [Clostridia bacterium]
RAPRAAFPYRRRSFLNVTLKLHEFPPFSPSLCYAVPIEENKEVKTMLRVLFWPFKMLWSFVGVVFLAIGKLMSLLLGLLITVIGAVLCATLVGAIVGIPLIILGVTMMIRSLF